MKKNFTGLAFDSVLMVFTKIVTLFLGILTTKLMSKYINLADNGTYSQSLVIIEAVTALITFGLTDAVNYFYNSEANKDKQRKIVNTIFFLETVLGITATILIFALSMPLCDYFNNANLYGVLLIMSVQPMVDNLVAMLQVLYVSNKKGKLIAIRNFCISLIRLMVVFFGCFFLQNLYFVVIGFIITGIGQLILFWIWFKKFGFFINIFKFDKEFIKPILKFGLPLGLYILVNSLLRISDKAVLGSLLTVEEMAIYSYAAKTLPFDIISSSFITIITPFITKYIASNNKEKLSDILSGYLKISFISTIVLTSGAILFSKDLMLFLYDSKYLPGLPIFIVYLFTDMIKFCSLYIVMMSYKRNKELLVVSIISLCLNLSLDVGLYFIFGPIGCAIATLIVTLLNMIYLFIRIKKLTKIKFNSLFKYSDILIVILCIFIVSILLGKIYSMLPEIILFNGFKVVIFYSLFCLFCFGIMFRTIKNSICLINRSEER